MIVSSICQELLALQKIAVDGLISMIKDCVPTAKIIDDDNDDDKKFYY